MKIQARMSKNNEIKKAIDHTAPDIIVEKITYEENIENDGTRIIKPIKTKINLSKKMKETAKTIKRETIIDIENELNRVFEEKKAELKKEITNKK